MERYCKERSQGSAHPRHSIKCCCCHSNSSPQSDTLICRQKRYFFLHYLVTKKKKSPWSYQLSINEACLQMSLVLQASDSILALSLNLDHNRVRISRKWQRDDTWHLPQIISPVFSICHDIKEWFLEEHGLITLWPNKAWISLTHPESLIINFYLNLYGP